MGWGIAIAFMQAVCWAGTGLLLKQLSTKMDLYLANGLRALIGLAFLLPVVWITGGQADVALLTPYRVGVLLLTIVLGALIGEVLYIGALKRLGVGRTLPISNCHPLFTVLLSAPLLGEPLRLPIIIGAVVVLLGVYVVARPDSRKQHPDHVDARTISTGIAMAVGAALCWGLGTVILAFGTEAINPALANAVRLPLVVLASLAIAARRGTVAQIKGFDRGTVVLLIVAGIVSWVLTRTLYVAAVQKIGPSMTAIIGATAPVYAIPMSWALIGERPRRSALAGTVLTVIGIILVVR